ncbi:hypothetical protein AB0M95_40540 [Sphaerisporangium sp. NPDC051017]|uniref:hypothetical protein n=1 Tax=unclassified Sphaerisporangium TaxID=2630420 RepID=UPI0033ECC2DF
MTDRGRITGTTVQSVDEQSGQHLTTLPGWLELRMPHHAAGRDDGTPPTLNARGVHL